MSPGETIISLAEDGALVRNLIQLMLTKEGYAVLSANDGPEALELSELFKDPIHLLLRRANAPDGRHHAEGAGSCATT